MANAKEIRTKIKSIQSTQKITRAMEMVAASKMRKAQERMVATRPYLDKIYNVIQHFHIVFIFSTCFFTLLYIFKYFCLSSHVYQYLNQHD